MMQKIRMEALMVGEDETGTHHWEITVHYDGAEETFDYFTGPAITEDPKKSDVLACLALDDSILEECSDHWELAAYFGTEPTRENADCFDKLKANREKLEMLFGDDWADIAQHYASLDR